MSVSFATVLPLLLPFAAAGHGGLRFVTGTPLRGPDSLSDELVDQANPNFEKISKGDGCISFEDLYSLALSKVPEGPDRDELAPRIKNMTLACFDAMDAIDEKDGCVSKDEFRKGGGGAKPPPKVPSKVVLEMRKVEFQAMDQNNDHRISRSEAYDFVSSLEHASIHHEKVDAVFDAADTDHNKFLSEDEYMSAGQNYKGDGPNAFFLDRGLPTLLLFDLLNFVASHTIVSEQHLSTIRASHNDLANK
jgi:hypothetical protein